MKNTIYTIGHSNHSTDKFISLLKTHNVSAVADVRSAPYSKRYPNFNKNILQIDLKRNNISYVFLGKELGPRSNDPSCYIDGKVQYDLIAATNKFREGIKRLKDGMDSYRIAIMCSEKDPIFCHRTILVCKYLEDSDVDINHILYDGSIEKHDQAMRRLMKQLKINDNDMFSSFNELKKLTYDIQSRKIAFTVKDSSETDGESSQE